MSGDTIDRNKNSLATQLERFFRLGTEQAAKYIEINPKELVPPKVLDNLSWTGNLTLLDFLRDVGKYAKVNVMVTRDSVKSRLESSQGISFTEFSYQLLQAHDYFHLYTTYGCRLQVGGADQWGNIVAGTDLIRRRHTSQEGQEHEQSEPAFGLTVPLLTTPSGEKFGKSAGNAVWLDPEMTPVLDFYQYFVRQPDTAARGLLTMVKDTSGNWSLAGGESEGAAVHPVFELLENNKPSQGDSADKDKNSEATVEAARMAMLKVVNGFRPAETVFEIGTRGKKEVGAILMKDRRKALEKAQKRVGATSVTVEDSGEELEENGGAGTVQLEMADEDDIETAFGGSKKRKRSHKDEEYFMSHYQKDAYTEKGYSLRDGATFAEQARNATFDLTNDEALTGRQRHDKQLNWDAKKKKFVKGSGEGADNVKIVKTESGARLPATYRSGRFEEWKTKTKVWLPKVGEAENERRFGGKGGRVAGKKFMHQGKKEAKPLDPLALGYERKLRQTKKRGEKEKAFEAEDDVSGGRGGKGVKPGKGGKNVQKATGRRYGGKTMGRVKNELKSADQIRKSREAMAKKKAKNARPSKKGKGRR
ncbi:unnamed protein product [Rhizoctonia solani]|uniref:Tyrosine--tRNA ligase n=1 Tax=Rhizoctonia solani TaxID=456999 RepID=A0A8H3DXG1_9AGAM|nr:unnamed protein product [Rhizoctonia solani]